MSKAQKLVLIIGIVLLLVFGLIVFNVTREDKGQISTNQSTSPPISSQSDSIKSEDIQGSAKLTKTEVAQHNSANDCWTIIENKVYDISDYISRHPGGDVIVQTCGTDGTTLFTQRKTSDGQSVGSGTPHDSTAEDQLNNYLLGPLEN